MKKIPVILLIAIVGLNSCIFDGPRVKGNGHVTTENKQLGEVTGVELHAFCDVYLIEGSAAGVKIEGEDNIISHIMMHVENGVLNIETEDDIWLSSHKPVKIFVTAPVFNHIESTGSGDIISQTKINNSDKLKIGLSGSGDLQLDVDAPEINASASGSGDIKLTGETRKFNCDISGSGDIKALDLKTEESDLGISGSGNINVFTSVKLDANISGSGDVRYKGDAQVNSNISGSGRVKKVN